MPLAMTRSRSFILFAVLPLNLRARTHGGTRSTRPDMHNSMGTIKTWLTTQDAFAHASRHAYLSCTAVSSRALVAICECAWESR